MEPGFCASLHLSFSFLTLPWPKSPLNPLSGVSACPQTGQFSNGVIIKQKTTALLTLATAAPLVSHQSGIMSPAQHAVLMCFFNIWECDLKHWQGKILAQSSTAASTQYSLLRKNNKALKICLASLSMPRAALVSVHCQPCNSWQGTARHGTGTCSSPSLEPKSQMQRWVPYLQCHSNFVTSKSLELICSLVDAAGEFKMQLLACLPATEGNESW